METNSADLDSEIEDLEASFSAASEIEAMEKSLGRNVDGYYWQTLDESPRAILEAALDLDTSSFPRFLSENSADRRFMWLLDAFKDDQVVFLDEAKEKVLAAGFSAPIHLDDGVPENGWDGAVDKVILDYKNQRPPNALLAYSVSVAAESRGQKMGEKVLKAFIQRAKELGLTTLIVPARPSGKGRYPEMSMEEYVSKYNQVTNEHIDPWIRAQQRCGGKVIGIGKNSHVPRSSDGGWPSVQQWEVWTGMQFPAEGNYDIPQGNSKLYIHDGVGEYKEDCVWIKYDLDELELPYQLKPSKRVENLS